MRARPALVVPGPSSSPSSAGSQGDAQTTLTDGQQVLIAPATPAVLRRAVPLAGDAGGITATVDRRLLAPGHDRMLPVVAEVVGIGETGHARSQHPVHRQPLLVDRVINIMRIAVLSASDV